MSRICRAIVATAVLMGAAACGNSSPATHDARQGQAAPAAASPARRDPATLKACEIVSPSEAAAIIGGGLLNEPPAGFSNCAYVVTVDGRTESYRLVFTEPNAIAAMLAAQDEKEKGERVADLLDDAYVQESPVGPGVSVVAVARGDVALEVNGERRDPAVAIAKLAASRLRWAGGARP